MSKKLYEHIVLVDYLGIATKINKYRKPIVSKRNQKSENDKRQLYIRVRG